MNYNEIMNLVFDNIKKIAFPEEWLNIDMALSKQDLFAMLLIDRNGEIIMSQIADYINVPMSTATGIIDRLVKNDYIQRERSDTDRRVVVIKLAEKGRSLVDNVKKMAAEYIQKVSEELTEEERELIFKIFSKVLKVLNEKSQGTTSDEQDKAQLRKISIE